MTISDKLSALRDQMQQRKLDAYIIPTDDFHASEYVGSYFKVREYFSGFTGSAGTLIVLKDKAALWTDSRYFLQAEDQLQNSTITLMKAGLPDTPTMGQYLDEELPETARIGYDGRVITADFAKRLRTALKAHQITFEGSADLADFIWKDRPAISKEPVWEISETTAGLSRREKLCQVRQKLSQRSADLLVIPTLSEIAWLTNLRGNDIACTPVFLSYLIISQTDAKLFANCEIFSSDILEQLSLDGFSIFPYEHIFDALLKDCAGKHIWIDDTAANERLMQCLSAAASVIQEESPISLMKSIKTPAEQNGMIQAHIRDGVAVTRFIYWLQKNVSIMKITELDAADKLLAFRKAQKGFLDISFDSIIAYGAHGAIVHYDPSPETNIVMSPRSFCLADTGAHYVDGTTDVTRTIPLGALSDEEKKAYTLVLKGHLRLGSAVFPHGLSGQNLDYLAHEDLWRHGLDYGHGTGHGVGFLLSVHEGPQRIHWTYGKKHPVTLEEGMITSNEPGLYVAGKFGIRHENLVLCQKGEQTEYGQFMYLKPLTMVPFDKQAIDESLFDDVDYQRLNAYHKLVWETLEPYFTGDERVWLQQATAPINSRS